MIHVEPIEAFDDNYIWVIRNDATSNCLVVDPGEAEPVAQYLKRHQLSLEAILITHKHGDHIGGVKELQSEFQAPSFGPRNEADYWVDNKITQSDHLSFPLTAIDFTIIELPGHTLGHIAYLSGDKLFCGDTLFVAGCGRVFEGTMEQMYRSIQALSALDEATKIYCAHEYTLANLRFALTVEPDNETLKQFTAQAKQLREANKPTVPTTIGLEKRINPFMRCDQSKVAHAAQQHGMINHCDPVDVFATIRRWKDNF